MKASKKTRTGRGQNPKSRANLKPPFDGSKPGPGRKKDSPAMKEVKALLKSTREVNKDLLSEMVESGEYRKLILEMARSKNLQVRQSAFKWLLETGEPAPVQYEHKLSGETVYSRIKGILEHENAS